MTAQRRDGGLSGPSKSNGATSRPGTITTQLPPLEDWRQLADTIDSHLTTGDDWPVLARAIQDAHDAGRDVARELGQLADGRPFSTEGHATELRRRLPPKPFAYRLRAATQTTSDMEPTPSRERKQTAVDPIVRSEVDTQTSRRDPDRPRR